GLLRKEYHSLLWSGSPHATIPRTNHDRVKLKIPPIEIAPVFDPSPRCQGEVLPQRDVIPCERSREGGRRDALDRRALPLEPRQKTSDGGDGPAVVRLRRRSHGG